MNQSFFVFPCFSFWTNSYVKHREYDFSKSADRSAFRKTKAWKDFRATKMKEQNNRDPITLKKLSKTANCHHMDLCKDNYDLLNPESFIVVNSQTHDFLHWALAYYQKDPTFKERLFNTLDKMVKLNKPPKPFH